MGFSAETVEEVLVACGRCCCLCGRFCGTKIQTHHIVPEGQGGSHEFDNCIPLCLDCHAEVESYNPRHPIGRKFTPAELRKHRDRHYQRMGSGGGGRVTATSVDADRKTLDEVVQALPPDGAIQWVRGLEFIGAFSARSLPRLLAFAQEYCSRPDKEFLDHELEALRRQLIGAIFDLNAAITHFTTPARGALPGNEDVRECPPIPWKDDPWNERVERAYSKLHSGREEVLSSYDGLIRAARRKLAT
jgi:HNH endonuclease